MVKDLSYTAGLKLDCAGMVHDLPRTITSLELLDTAPRSCISGSRTVTFVTFAMPVAA